MQTSLYKSSGIDNFINKTAKIKTPAPSLSSVEAAVQSNETNESDKRKIIRPCVGVVDVPKISSMPINDTIEIKREENPYTIYKPSFKKIKMLNFQTIASVLIGLCGVGSLLSLIKKK